VTAPGPSPSPATPAVPDVVTGALQQVLRAQHAAVFGYSLIGVRLSERAQVASARTLQAAHRLTRDELMAQIAQRGATPDEAQASYAPTESVRDATSAQRWALQLEQDCAAGYRYLLAAAVSAGGQQLEVRRQALAGLTSAAESATQWRALLTPVTPTVAFPGM
jgi:hypothetical protein